MEERASEGTEGAFALGTWQLLGIWHLVFGIFAPRLCMYAKRDAAASVHETLLAEVLEYWIVGLTPTKIIWGDSSTGPHQ